MGTVTEIHDYLRLLYARIVAHCPQCGRVIEKQPIDRVVEQVLELGNGAKLQILAPAIRGRKGEYAKLFEQINRDGYVRVMVDSEVYDIEEVPQLDKNKKHNIDVVIDRIVIKDNIRTRLNDSLEAAFTYGAGLAKVVVIKDEGNEEMLFSQNYACPDCNISIEELSPRMFSFNNPFGACPECMGLGMILRVDPNTVIADPKLSLRQGAISTAGWQQCRKAPIASMYFKALSEHYGFSLDTPWRSFTKG